MELDALRDPQRLAARAKKLGMVPPPSPAFVRLSDGKVLGTPGAATALDAIRINPLPAAKPKVAQAPKPRIVKVAVPRTAATRKSAQAPQCRHRLEPAEAVGRRTPIRQPGANR